MTIKFTHVATEAAQTGRERLASLKERHSVKIIQNASHHDDS